MCLTRCSNDGPKYALEDIVVYKILSSNLLSPYQEYQYELNKKVYSPLEYFVAYSALGSAIGSLNKKTKYTEHFYKRSYSRFLNDIIILPIIKKGVNYFYYDEIAKGLHAYTKIERARGKMKLLSGNCYSLNVFKCVIPKYSWYYLGASDEIVSDQLIVIEKID